MNPEVVFPTISNIRNILGLDFAEANGEALVTELTGFLTRQQTIITRGNNNGTMPFRTTPSGKYVVSDSIVRDMATLGAFAKNTAGLSKFFQDMFASMEVEYFDPLGLDDPVPYSIQQ